MFIRYKSTWYDHYWITNKSKKSKDLHSFKIIQKLSTMHNITCNMENFTNFGKTYHIVILSLLTISGKGFCFS